MSWKKYFSISAPNSALPVSALAAHNEKMLSPSGTSSNYSSYLPEVYAGHPNRIQRYYQYDDMDRDSDINCALDTIADFCTQSEEQNDEPFDVHYNDDANETEINLLKRYLTKWTKLNDFRSKLFYIFRNTLKNGDAFFLRDPETKEWLWLDHFNVEMVKVEEENGKEPEVYFVRGFDFNREAKFATRKADMSQYRTPWGAANFASSKPPAPGGGAGGSFQMTGSNRDVRQMRSAVQGNEMFEIDASHVVHLSLSVGMDINWPFGQSVLEPIFKTFKQKELLEDSIIIYRVQRAPERRVFYIDVGSMPPAKARAHLDQIKNEIHQRRIPNHTGGGSSIMDAAYNPLCLAMDTRIPLLDGRTLTISELSEEYHQGKENWVYSCDPITGAIMPGNITWAGVTKKAAKVIKLTLDNGEVLTCTPDHKIPVLGKGFVEAQNLTVEDSLIAFNTRQRNIDRNLSNERTYTQIYDHDAKKWVYVHRMVGDFFRKLGKHQEYTFLPENIGKTKTVIHHKDYNRYNNDPRNLAFMDKNDHIAYHVFSKKDYWENITEEESTRIRTKISDGLKEYYGTLNPDEKNKLSEAASARNKVWIADKKANDIVGWTEWRKKVGQGNSEFFKNNPEAGKARAKKGVANRRRPHANQLLNVSQSMIRMIVDLVKASKPTRIQAAEILSSNDEFLRELSIANPPQPNANNHIDYSQVSPQKLDLILERGGYQGWRSFTRDVANYNHRVVSIEIQPEEIEVGTITIDGQERWHKNHTFAIEGGIFVKNSIVEDYFFAQGSEGRGSKVETLAGGEGLGEITDLSFFAKKMARGLRIPSSYLSLGDDDSNVAYNDGKLGAAMIQEFRFNKYCMRLQALLAPVFDREFKEYLKASGIEIDPGLFELKFNEPQNFTKYRQVELDQAQVGIYQMVADNRRLSERFKLKRFLNLSEDELLENEKLWSEENAAKLKRSTGASPAEDNIGAGAGLPDIGIRPPSDDMMGDMPPPEDGMEGGDPMGGAGGPPGGPGGAPPGPSGGAGAPPGGGPLSV